MEVAPEELLHDAHVHHPCVVDETRDDGPDASRRLGGRRGRRRKGPLPAVAGVAIVVAAAGIELWRVQYDASPPPTLVPLTSARNATGACLSPDGTQIAFAAPDDDASEPDIWLKIIGGPDSRRLTTDPLPDISPAWSPDGKQIAFLRQHPGMLEATIHLVSPLGGGERRLSDLVV
jgi:hypothetical protein